MEIYDMCIFNVFYYTVFLFRVLLAGVINRDTNICILFHCVRI